MLSPLMILSLDQGKLAPAPRSVGPFDARLLEDVADCIAEPKVPAAADPQTAGLMAFIRKRLMFWPARSVNWPVPRPAQLHRPKP
jgi:CRISPR/Cas system CMR subunit Cmr4 (Cas7 group RAMP superfamily)